jgi:UDP-N-acetylglucosamine 2-epimerase (non-hydrolysing)
VLGSLRKYEVRIRVPYRGRTITHAVGQIRRHPFDAMDDMMIWHGVAERFPVLISTPTPLAALLRSSRCCSMRRRPASAVAAGTPWVATARRGKLSGRMRVMHIVGARPNFMKAAPVVAEMARHPDLFESILVHTGQHYDETLSAAFLRDLELPTPDVFLGIGSGTHAQQAARVLLALEPVLRRYCPDWVVVVGDVNSTAAAALAASKLGIRVAHVEAGLRSFDRSMPEEINRIITDHVSDLLFTTEESGNHNLRREGIPDEKVRFVGNVMIDSLVRYLKKAERSEILGKLGRLERGQYVVVTLHRPSNVDEPAVLTEILAALERISAHLPIVFPAHPRARQRMAAIGWRASAARILVPEPLAYLDFLGLLSQSRLVLTDSGGIQEETTFLGIPCLTLRPNTERPVTIRMGTNQLVDPRSGPIVAAAEAALNGGGKRGNVPPLWDGRAAQRIVGAFRAA